MAAKMWIVWAQSSRHTPAKPDYAVVDMVRAQNYDGHWATINGRSVYIKGAIDKAVEATGRKRQELELAPIGDLRFASTAGYNESQAAHGTPR